MGKDLTPLMGSIRYKDGLDFGKVLNDSLNIFFKDALRVALTDPSQAYHFLRTIRWQKKAARIRSDWEKQGVHVPPILIFSITSRCNLHCKGCYHWALRPSVLPEMEVDKLRSIITEAKTLGISFIMIAGGEPLVRMEILDIIQEFPEITFLVFTNGLLIDEALTLKLKNMRNFVPVISLEGYEKETNERRGAGVYERLQGIVKILKHSSLTW
jgi:MoaA/NifB/PqqE/SkfB family radical SAM enzyme